MLFAVDVNALVNLFFPTTVPVNNSTPIGAAELAGDITTRDLSTFLFNNIVLYGGNLNNCCIIGFHAYDFEPGDKKNGSRERRLRPNLFQLALIGPICFRLRRHHTAEPRTSRNLRRSVRRQRHTVVASVDPVLGGGLCQNDLETGDVIEVLNSSVPTYSIAMNGRTYHPQNEALFSWFAFQSPSHAHLGAYSFPDETTLPSRSPGNLLPGCAAAP